MTRDLRGRTIVITGASSGIGAATAIECAAAGMNVVMGARRAPRLEQVAGQVRQSGGRAEVVVGDVTEAEFSSRLLEAAERTFGSFDAVFANAGYGLQGPAVELADGQLRRIFEVNFFAAVDLVATAGRRLRDAGRPGHLLMCSSCLAKFTLPLHSAYSATKAAQAHVCRAMRIELAPHGIEVSSVHPVTTATELFEVMARLGGRDPAEHALPRHSPRRFVQPPQRVARAVVRCLRRPRPEVWTSFTVRLGAALMTMFPSMTDLIMRRALERDARSGS
jgi:short-subunit dehydrogenase